MDHDQADALIRVLDALRPQLEALRIEQRAATLVAMSGMPRTDMEAVREVLNAFTDASALAKDAYERSGR